MEGWSSILKTRWRFAVEFKAEVALEASRDGASRRQALVRRFRFDVPVRFDTDQLQVISRAYNLQNVQSNPLVEIRA